MDSIFRMSVNSMINKIEREIHDKMILPEVLDVNKKTFEFIKKYAYCKLDRDKIITPQLNYELKIIIDDELDNYDYRLINNFLED